MAPASSRRFFGVFITLFVLSVVECLEVQRLSLGRRTNILRVMLIIPSTRQRRAVVPLGRGSGVVPSECAGSTESYVEPLFHLRRLKEVP